MIDKVGFGRINNQLNHHRGIKEQVYSVLKFQLVDQYGWQLKKAECYINEYLKMDTSKRFAKQIGEKYNLYEKRVLEVGSGLGNVLIQMKSDGINAVGIEPSEEFCDIIVRRLEQHRLDINCVIRGCGETLPFNDAAFDFVLSMQVMEHVNEPDRVFSEIDRVLKRGGICYIMAPNYMSFREYHYRVFWLPMMPKALAKWYLRLRRRNPAFLQNHINYINFLGVVRIERRLRWENLMLKSFLEELQNPSTTRSGFQRILVGLVHCLNPSLRGKIGTAMYYLRNLFRPQIVYQYCKH